MLLQPNACKGRAPRPRIHTRGFTGNSFFPPTQAFEPHLGSGLSPEGRARVWRRSSQARRGVQAAGVAVGPGERLPSRPSLRRRGRAKPGTTN